MNKDYRKYYKLLADVRQLAHRIEQEFCVCHQDYIKIGRIDPGCQAHEISDFILDWETNYGTPNNAL